ncbi:Multidrug resistance-associated protein 1, partial [Physocladia obscura]
SQRASTDTSKRSVNSTATTKAKFHTRVATSAYNSGLAFSNRGGHYFREIRLIERYTAYLQATTVIKEPMKILLPFLTKYSPQSRELDHASIEHRASSIEHLDIGLEISLPIFDEFFVSRGCLKLIAISPSLETMATTVSTTLETYAGNPPPLIESSDLLSFVTLSWISKLVWLGRKRPLEFKDLPFLPVNIRSENIAHILDEFHANLKEYLKNPQEYGEPPSYFMDLWRFIRVPYCFSVLLNSIQVVMQTTQPVVMAGILSYLSTGDSGICVTSPIGLAMLFFFMSFLSLIFNQTSQQLFRRIQFGVQNTILSAVFEKSLKLSAKSSAEFSKGQILQMVNIDVSRISMFISELHSVVLVPFQLAFSIYYLANIFGVDLYPVGIGMKLVKLRAQENFFMNALMKYRRIQLSATVITLIAMVVLSSLATIAPSAMMLGTVHKLLLAEESEFMPVPLNDATLDAIKIENASFKWSVVKEDLTTEESEILEKKTLNKDKKVHEENDEVLPLFKNLNLKVAAFKLTAIVGTVGSGKSSLLSAIVGDMERVNGTLETYGSIALCQQQPWLMSTTIQQNILFGSSLDVQKLAETIRVCGLDIDIQQFKNGLETHVGENGITLSGGQKSRVALARAVYKNSDVYLLDDPLAALDAHVGKQIFYECLTAHLQGKTRVLVTHQLQVLPNVDYIIVLDKGVVVEQGTYADLVIGGCESGVLKEMLKNQAMEEKKDQVSKSKTAKEFDYVEDIDGEGGRLIKEEDRQTGAVGKQHVISYIKEAGGYGMFGLILLATIFFTAVTFLQSVWLNIWTNDSTTGVTRYGLQHKDYITVYAVISVATVIFSFVQYAVILGGTFRATKRYHNKAIMGVLRASMGWFDSQPLGRILNRLTHDVNVLDAQIGFKVSEFFTVLCSSIVALIQANYASPYLLIATLVFVVGSFFLLNFYRSNARELKRLAQLSASPMISFINECIGGTTTIRVFQAVNHSIKNQRLLTDHSLMPIWTGINVQNWFSFRVEGGTVIITLFIVLYAVLENPNAALIGIALTGVSNLGSTFFSCITSFASMETTLVSVERLDMYCHGLDMEAATRLETDPAESEWPKQGQISISQLEVKYNSMLDPAIKNLSVEIKGGEKIGVVGRTGSGKSTLMISLFRLVEPTKGTVVIDGLDVSKLGLYTLRTRLQIIPQEPVLFSGTIRTNIDFENKFKDSEIWEALELVGLKEYIAQLRGKLDASTTERGVNLSVGQRQLIMLATAICHKPKILVLDEASSSVDQAADLLIQSSIRTHFQTTTVISIAHRVNTITDFDRVMVLDMGRLAEYDTPINLLNCNSLFKSLVDATGAANAKCVRSIAENH